MDIQKEYFDRIKSKEKTIELRLFDEKRQKLRVGDTIEFTSNDSEDVVLTKITELIRYHTFKELIDNTDIE